MTRAPLTLALALALALAGCSTTDEPTGADEPIRVRSGAFKPGDLPGIVPPDAGAGGGAAAPAQVSPRVTVLNTVNRIVWPGESGKVISGNATTLATAVGVRSADLGTGYWLVPTGLADPLQDNDLAWTMTFDVNWNIPPGLHTLRFGAVDQYQRAGSLTDLEVCVTSAVPDNYNACDPTVAPPFAVLSLTWDSAADLDLVVRDPNGKWIDPKHPTTAGIGDGGVLPNLKIDGAFDHDANANCAGDALHAEHLVWQSKPQLGQYLVYVNMFASCGASAARFDVSLNLEASSPDGGTHKLVDELDVPGELLGTAANGGTSDGLYVTSFTIQ